MQKALSLAVVRDTQWDMEFHQAAKGGKRRKNKGRKNSSSGVSVNDDSQHATQSLELKNGDAQNLGLQQECKGLHRKNKALELEKHALERENESLAQENTRVQNDAEELRVEHKNLRRQNKGLQKDHDGLQNENHGLQRMIKALQRENEGVKQQNELLQAQLMSAQSRIEELEKANAMVSENAYKACSASLVTVLGFSLTQSDLILKGDMQAGVEAIGEKISQEVEKQRRTILELYNEMLAKPPESSTTATPCSSWSDKHSSEDEVQHQSMDDVPDRSAVQPSVGIGVPCDALNDPDDGVHHSAVQPSVDIGVYCDALNGSHDLPDHSDVQPCVGTVSIPNTSAPGTKHLSWVRVPLKDCDAAHELDTNEFPPLAACGTVTKSKRQHRVQRAPTKAQDEP